MNNSALGDKLITLYSQWRASLTQVKNGYEHLSPPLILAAKSSYELANRRAFVVGQETFGWSWTRELRKIYPLYKFDYPYDNICSLQDFVDVDQGVQALSWAYNEFEFANAQPTTARSPFWQGFREVQNRLNCAVIWNNVSRCDFKGGSILKSPTPIREWMAKTQSTLFEQELKILNPNICFFLSGHHYDEMLSEIFPGIQYHAVENISIRKLARLVHPSLPKSSFRTYHPKYLLLSKQWHVLEKAIDLAGMETS